MDDHEYGKPYEAISEITPELKAALNETRAKLKGFDRRRFMAQILIVLGRGGQRRAMRELGWNRNVNIKGIMTTKRLIMLVRNLWADCFTLARVFSGYAFK